MKTFIQRLALVALMAIPVSTVAAQTARLADAEKSLAGFGSAVAATNDAIIVGESGNTDGPGAVYAYARNAAGEWAESGKLMGSIGKSSDGFGASVSLAGDVLAVGASYRLSSGTTYIFERSNDEWREVAAITAADGTEGDAFGTSAVTDGEFVFSGAPLQNENFGAVYVYRKSGGTWQQTQKITVEESDEYRFGAEIGVDGDWLFISATRDGAGSVYVFKRNGDLWEQHSKIAPEGLEDGNRFGSSIDVKDGKAIISAPRANSFVGTAMVYKLDENDAWTLHTTLVPFDTPTQARFGTDVAIADGQVWVGAPGVDNFGGTVYTIDISEAGWSGVSKLGHDSIKSRDFFSGSIAVAENVAAVAIPGADFGAGTVAVFEKENSSWMPKGLIFSDVTSIASITDGQVTCSDGKAGDFECADVDLISFLSVEDLGGGRGANVNDLWGWTDEQSGIEYVIVGRVDGTAFVDISNPMLPRYLGNLPHTEGASPSTWRDIKVYKNHAFIVSDGAGPHGMQIFDLTQLRDIEEPVEFTATAHYDQIASAHNIVINEDTGFAYAVGSSMGGETCGGGLHMINIQEPTRPTFAGCFADETTGRRNTGYSHDAQCIVYNGPDAEHVGKEICFGANETALSIADVSDKENPIALAAGDYPNVAYSHQGWVTEDHRFFFMNDELDELTGNVSSTRTLIWDVSDLDDPKLLKEYFSEQKASDHNLYIKGNLMYQSNYVAGLRIIDITDVENPVEVAYFDTVPGDENAPGFDGSWSNYPYFKSGVIVVTSGAEGMFIVKKRDIGS